MKNLKMLIRITRAPFFTATIVPGLVGAMIAWSQGFLSWWHLLVTVLGIVRINAGLDMSNDYYDHVSGGDAANQELTPFSGGSRVIQDRILRPRQVLMGSLAFYAAGIVIGLYLAAVRGWPVLALGLGGVFLAFFHNAPPVKIYHLAPGLGELAVAIGCGPIIVLGSYYVQAQRLGAEALWASIPIGLLVAAVLYINEFPDCEADRAAGRKTLPVTFGRRRASWGYAALLVGAYVVMLAGIALGVFPSVVLLAFLTLPLAYRGIRGALRFHSDTPRLIPTMAVTIQLHMLTGLLLCLSYVVARIV